MLTDRAAALHLLRQETIEFDKVQTDQRIQRSMYQAMLSDCRELSALLEEEAATSTDASAQGQLGGASDQRAPRESGREGYYEDDRVDPNGRTDLVTYIESLKLDEEHAPRECYICMVDTIYSLTTEVGECNHVWCRGCLVRALDLATKNESHYPVRCCGQSPSIPLDHPGVATLVGAEAIPAVEAKIVEYGTEDKTYCHDAGYSAFIAPATIDETKATCPMCLKTTCARCKAEFHEGEDCKTVNDEAFEQWQRDNESATCYACHRVIIISHGASVALNSAMNATTPGRRVNANAGTKIAFSNVLPWSPGARRSARDNLPTSSVLLRSCVMKNHVATPAGLELCCVLMWDLMFVQIVIGRVTSFCGYVMDVICVYARDADETTSVAGNRARGEITRSNVQSLLFGQCRVRYVLVLDHTYPLEM
ncbi:hypothetical protein A1O7_07355 [Cladophialophora yegresii CBS 114405]|uniref:IBR domain-containing protein n=1 Tax=Cladophialophora yegresii CBS 114405 TaxID=1182544 RepID=W9VXQ6_9EURO|nr:uncharacterized protein A1O7_07355 [Cladophialophora yegresii CBS 114405]EXJ57011.1 hypothetical protein A1O7_07355 [Cladophialophora yegresii CBS 114405]